MQVCRAGSLLSERCPGTVERRLKVGGEAGCSESCGRTGSPVRCSLSRGFLRIVHFGAPGANRTLEGTSLEPRLPLAPRCPSGSCSSSRAPDSRSGSLLGAAIDRTASLHRRRAGALLRRPQRDRGSGTAARLRHTERTDRRRRGSPARVLAVASVTSPGTKATAVDRWCRWHCLLRRAGASCAQRNSSSVTPPAPRGRRWKRRGGSLRSPERATPFAV